MATLLTLAGDDGPLTSVHVRLGRNESPERLFYACQDFVHYMMHELPGWQCGRLNAAQTPREQLDTILRKRIAGREMRYGDWLKDLTPRTDEVWELKTPDLRIFGWIYRPLVFIAAFMDYADWYKEPTKIRTYQEALNRVRSARNALDLDPPKFTPGEFDALVCV